MDGFILPDDALVQALFHVQQLFRFGFHHLADRDARPLGNHLGDIIDIHHFIQLVFGFPFVALGVEFFFQAQALGFLVGGALVIAFQAGLFFFGLQAVEFRFSSLSGQAAANKAPRAVWQRLHPSGRWLYRAGAGR